jgi:phage I-like protein
VTALATVDMPGVEILSVGGPVRGVGSPIGGDFYTRDQLRAMAAASAELAGELRPPAKIGHGSDQPAVGWLDNVRMNEAGDKLLADVKHVPRRVADLIKAKAYRHRSVELSRYTSQRTGKRYELAVTGLAWLGAKLPAVQTLEDVVALYEGDGAAVRFRQVDAPGTVDPARLRQLEADIAALCSRTNRIAATRVVDAAIAEGRIGKVDRQRWLERAAVNVDVVAEVLAERPRDEARAFANAARQMSAAEADYAERDLAVRLGIDRKDLI